MNVSVIIQEIRRRSILAQKYIFCGLLLFTAVVVLFLSTYKISESPPIWMDEGIITQVAENVATQGVNGIQVAPGEFVSAGFVTTSYVVTYPIALFFKFFGVGLLQARAVMVLFLFAFFLVAYFLSKQQMPKTLAILSLLLLASFAPIYGNGKNVLGEIPGLVFLLAGLLGVGMIERGVRTITLFLLTGLFFGLCVVTKPIFILVIPAFVVPLYFYRQILLNSPKLWVLAVASFFIPVLAWLWIQFSGDSFANILSIYMDPHSTLSLNSVFGNLKRFVTESQPMYFMVLFVAWLTSFAVRLRKKSHISYVETITFLFTALVILAYVRTIGYYRYFFLGQVVALMYFPLTLSVLLNRRIIKRAVYPIITFLIFFQFYQTGFHSWVASYYRGTRTHEVQTYFKEQSPEQTFFIYQAPEIALFLPVSKYFQYMKVTSTILIGEDQLKSIEEGVPDQIVINSEEYDPKNMLFKKYEEKEVVDRYTILEKAQ